jgi:hypothetical protein
MMLLEWKNISHRRPHESQAKREIIAALFFYRGDCRRMQKRKERLRIAMFFWITLFAREDIL